MSRLSKGTEVLGVPRVHGILGSWGSLGFRGPKTGSHFSTMPFTVLVAISFEKTVFLLIVYFGIFL